jgi:hypothetical protein
MDTILGFFSDLILFTAGLAVLTMWIALIVLAVDEAIDLVVAYRNRNESEEDDNE